MATLQLSRSAGPGLVRLTAATCGIRIPLQCVYVARRLASSSRVAMEQAGTTQPNYYAVLNIARTASAEQIKAAFREQAKLYHPDVQMARDTAAGSAATPVADAVDMFKLVNEAYSVLSDPVMRKDYDTDRFSRIAMLRRRNEGVSAAEAAAPPREGYVAYDSSMGRGGGEGAATNGAAAPGDSAHMRQSFARGNARLEREEARASRATMARTNRVKIEVPTKNESMMAFLAPMGVFVLWAFNYVVFFR